MGQTCAMVTCIGLLLILELMTILFVGRVVAPILMVSARDVTQLVHPVMVLVMSLPRLTLIWTPLAILNFELPWTPRTWPTNLCVMFLVCSLLAMATLSVMASPFLDVMS